MAKKGDTEFAKFKRMMAKAEIDRKKAEIKHKKADAKDKADTKHSGKK